MYDNHSILWVIVYCWFVWIAIIVIFALIEDYEKLKAKVADNEVYITELLEEKTQAEEQYLKEKQIIISELNIHTCTVLDE